ncbi:MAG: Plug domain-containing protein, partial [Muribaculaceae bacterium]|nr:Plug domain-containing protein [Muribaculaceae bacterium]
MAYRLILSIVALCFIPGLTEAEEQKDSIHLLQEVMVTARQSNRDIIPVQTLSGEELNRLNSNSIADALRYFSGVQVKDYGGVGGIKTVNIRSMGTNHTGVVYDGVELGNAQNGQIDLGQVSLDN